MLHTSFLKLSARETLKGEYLRCVIGACIFFIPMYINTLINQLLIVKGLDMGFTGTLVTLIINIFVVDIFTVGFVRSLYRMKEPLQTQTYEEKRYDINLLLSGYQEGTKNTFKTMFLKRLRLFLWELLAVVPVVVFVGVILMMTSRPEIAGLMGELQSAIQNPTDDGIMIVVAYIIENCQYIVYMLLGTYVAVFLFMIPYIRKSYEYAMVPIILAEEPDMPSCEVFRKTREMMHGFRMRLFSVEVSFLGWIILAMLVAAMVGSGMGIYLFLALVMPYMNMTIIKFYNERKAMLAEKANENQEGMTDQ